MGSFVEVEKVLSPGMKYKHYAPNTHSILVYSDDAEKLVNEIKNISNKYKKVLILSSTENKDKFEKSDVIDIGSKKNLLEISHNIFKDLRKIDEFKVDVAIIEGVKPEGIGLAIMNRLIRACEHDYRNIT